MPATAHCAVLTAGNVALSPADCGIGAAGGVGARFAIGKLAQSDERRIEMNGLKIKGSIKKNIQWKHG